MKTISENPRVHHLKVWAPYFAGSCSVSRNAVENRVGKAMATGRSVMKIHGGRECRFSRLSEKACRFEYLIGTACRAAGVILV